MEVSRQTVTLVLLLLAITSYYYFGDQELSFQDKLAVTSIFDNHQAQCKDQLECYPKAALLTIAEISPLILPILAFIIAYPLIK